MEALYHIDGDPLNDDPANLRVTKLGVETIARTYWKFGDIVRVDPAKNPKVPQPDDRRWMVLVAANTSANRQWTLMALNPIDPSIGEPIVSHWSSVYGFQRVEE